MLISDTARFDGVRVVSVDEHVWRHTRRGDKYVTVIIDLTGSATGQGLPGCWTWSKAAPSRRLRSGLPTGRRPGATPSRSSRWKGSITVVRLAREALDRCRRRIQQQTCGHRGRSGDPLYSARRTLHTGADLLADTQKTRILCSHPMRTLLDQVPPEQAGCAQRDSHASQQRHRPTGRPADRPAEGRSGNSSGAAMVDPRRDAPPAHEAVVPLVWTACKLGRRRG